MTSSSESTEVDHGCDDLAKAERHSDITQTQRPSNVLVRKRKSTQDDVIYDISSTIIYTVQVEESGDLPERQACRTAALNAFIQSFHTADELPQSSTHPADQEYENKSTDLAVKKKPTWVDKSSNITNPTNRAPHAKIDGKASTISRSNCQQALKSYRRYNERFAF